MAPAALSSPVRLWRGAGTATASPSGGRGRGGNHRRARSGQLSAGHDPLRVSGKKRGGGGSAGGAHFSLQRQQYAECDGGDPPYGCGAGGRCGGCGCRGDGCRGGSACQTGHFRRGLAPARSKRASRDARAHPAPAGGDDAGPALLCRPCPPMHA